MSTPENKVKKWIDDTMKKWYPSSVKYSPPGGMYGGRAGFPDRMWFIQGSHNIVIVVAIEAKAGDNSATALQLNTLKALISQGVIGAVVTGKDIGHMERIRAEVTRRMEVYSGL